MKLLVIGFDGLDYRLIQKYRDKIDFPHNLSLLEVQDLYTGRSWASFYTGLEKNKHRVLDAWGRQRKDFNTYVDIEDHVFWKIIEGNEYKVFVDNLPITYFGFPFDSDERKDIINWGYDALKQGEGKWRDDIREMGIFQIIEKSRKDSLELIDGWDYDCDLMAVQFSFVDRIGHTIHLSLDEVIDQTYNLVIEILNTVKSKYNPDNLILVSDHGFRGSEHTWDGALITYGGNFKIGKRFQQILIFDEIIKLFNIDYKKTTSPIPKTGRLMKSDKQKIEEKLIGLGYI